MEDKNNLSQMERNLIIHSLYCYIEHYYIARKNEKEDLYEIVARIIKKIGV